MLTTTLDTCATIKRAEYALITSESEAAMPDLVQRLTAAAVAAIANERPALLHPVGNVRGVTVELTLTSAGQVAEALVYVERRTTGGALLRRHTGKGNAA